jgi:hypothetical protein
MNGSEFMASDEDGVITRPVVWMVGELEVNVEVVGIEVGLAGEADAVSGTVSVLPLGGVKNTAPPEALVDEEDSGRVDTPGPDDAGGAGVAAKLLEEDGLTEESMGFSAAATVTMAESVRWSAATALELVTVVLR